MTEFQVNQRRFADVKKLFSEDYKKIKFQHKDDDIVYYGVQYTSNPKPPNITVLPNLIIPTGYVLGSTMGHQHTQSKTNDSRKFQEIYEFLGYGAILLRSPYQTRLHILKPKEKVLVTTEDNMTILNLDKTPLLTLDYANPEMNQANKDLEEKIGPLVLIKFEESAREVSLHINQMYYAQEILRGDETVSPILVPNIESGEQLYNQLPRYQKDFQKAGIELVVGGNLPPNFNGEFQESLSELAMKRNKSLLDMLAMN